MTGKTHFNFRDVLCSLGIADDNKRVNWAVGHILRDAAVERGVPISRVLTPKTNPNASVAAPHCIASYPMSFLSDAKKLVSDYWGGRQAQTSLPF